MATSDSRVSIVDIDQLAVTAAETAINAEIEVLEAAGFVVREVLTHKYGPSHDPKEAVKLLGVIPSHLDHSNSAAHDIHLKSAQTMIPLPLHGLNDKDGDPLVKFVTGDTEVPGYNLADSEAYGVRWNNKATHDPFLLSIPMPQDVDNAEDMVVHILASKTGATVGDATTFTATGFFHTVGALHDADADVGGASSAMTGDATAKTVQEVTLTIASADVPASPSSLSLTLQPTDGTLATDDVVIEGWWIEYTPQLLTS